jgi:type IV pilus assembly protein PilB
MVRAVRRLGDGHGAPHQWLGDLLKRLGYVDETAVALALERQLRIPFVALEREHFDPRVKALVDADFARMQQCLLIRRAGERVVLVMADPLDFATLNAVEAICAGQADVRIATESDILDAINQAYAFPRERPMPKAGE